MYVINFDASPYAFVYKDKPFPNEFVYKLRYFINKINSRNTQRNSYFTTYESGNLKDCIFFTNKRSITLEIGTGDVMVGCEKGN